jgi:RNA polymerase sigma-70 factor (ECF subfamily)
MRAFAWDAKALVQGVRSNDRAAKEAFVRRFAARVDRIVGRVLRDTDRADVTQDVFVGALSSIHRLKQPSAVEAWVSSIAMLTVQKTLRKRSRRAWQRCFVDAAEEVRSEPIAPALDIDGRRALEGVREVLRSMPADERAMFTLRVVEGMELTEIAEASSVSLSTFKPRLARAQRRFVAHSNARRPELKRWVAHRDHESI